MAKLYTKNTWQDEVLSGLERYDIKDNAGTTTLEGNVQINLKTTVVQAGTPVSADLMNNLENGVDAIDALIDGLAFGTAPKGTFADVAARFTALQARADAFGLGIILGDGVNVLSTGVKGFVEVPFDCTIEAVRLVADASGSCVIDIWKDSYANFPPTVTDTITASAKPTLSSAQKYANTTLIGWTKTLSKGDWLALNVDSATIVKQVTLSITGKKTATA